MRSFLTKSSFIVILAACSTSGDKGVGTASAPRPDHELLHTFKKGAISKFCDAAIERSSEGIESIVSLPADKRNIDTTLLALERLMADMEESINPLIFMKEVNLDPAIREESLACANKLSPFYVATFLRRDLYQAVKSSVPRSKEEMRLFTETIKSFENNGLKLDDKKLAELKKLKEELAKIETDFDTNIVEDKSTVLLTTEELEGVPAPAVARFKKDSSGKHIITMSYPDTLAVLQNAKSSEARRKVNEAFLSRAKAKNLPLLKRAITLRQQIATMLGYGTWADYKTSQSRMAKSGAEVWKFLNELRGKLKISNQRDLAAMMAYKKKLDPKAGPLDMWDFRYLDHQLKQKKYSLDEETIREYFPSDYTVKMMMEVYSTILGINFERMEGVKVWSPDVQQYRITDKKTKSVIAYFYTDFIPREGKYNHAAAFQLRSGRIMPDGSYRKPISAIVANFNPPSADRPSLLSHSEVETLFHEFGHIMHQVLTTAPYASFSGTNTARDFVEAPSQMLEEWIWSPKILAKISGHYKDTKKKLPQKLLNQMVAAREFNRGYFYTRQLLFGTLDMTYHSNPPADIDTTATFARLHKELTGVEAQPNIAMEASFGHLMGYDAGYYGYLWSEVYAADMFTKFESAGLLSSAVGSRYRKVILEQGGMRDALELVKEFLGRNPSPRPFYRRLKI
jgi:thimet oligopeptidase